MSKRTIHIQRQKLENNFIEKFVNQSNITSQSLWQSNKEGVLSHRFGLYDTMIEYFERTKIDYTNLKSLSFVTWKNSVFYQYCEGERNEMVEYFIMALLMNNNYRLFKKVSSIVHGFTRKIHQLKKIETNCNYFIDLVYKDYKMHIAKNEIVLELKFNKMFCAYLECLTKIVK